MHVIMIHIIRKHDNSIRTSKKSFVVKLAVDRYNKIAFLLRLHSCSDAALVELNRLNLWTQGTI